ncbi:MAG: hypothetical protein NWR50_04470 [Crocinitomicaceae bacterium]|nr:hypothetical protein [Crocinitomicaceae bacterium]
MANLSTIETRLKAIEEAFSKLNHGKLTREELEELVVNTQELHERAIILRYKAFEEKIFGERTVEIAPVIETSVFEEPVAEPIQETPSYSIPELEIELKEEIVEESIEEIEDQPAFDFSLFDDSAEQIKEEVLEDNTFEHLSVSSTEIIEDGVHEEHITMEQVIVTPTEPSNQKFYARFSKDNTDLAPQIGMTSLSTLIGSFGLNERLQYINELFDGSSEAFSEAIKVLDNLSSRDEMLIRASAFANNHNWDLESETVEEFVLKLKRRYA